MGTSLLCCQGQPGRVSCEARLVRGILWEIDGACVPDSSCGTTGYGKITLAIIYLLQRFVERSGALDAGLSRHWPGGSWTSGV